MNKLVIQYCIGGQDMESFQIMLQFELSEILVKLFDRISI